MASPIKIKRSSVAGKVPTTSDLDLGELGVNTNDGKLFLKKDDGTATIVEVGGGSSGTATQVTVADESSDTTCFPVFTTAATGNQAPKTGTNLNFNSSNGTLTATTFSGSGSSLTGLTGASAATYGDGSNVAQIAVDANGRITGISNVSISGGGGSGSPLRYLHVDGSGSQAITTSLATVDFDTTIATSDASDFTVGPGGEITVVNAGTYYVEYSLDGDQSSGNNRVIVTGVVQVNGTAVTGSECSVYSRNTADGDFTAVGSCIADLTANDVVRVQVRKNDGNITTSIELDTSGLSIFSLSGSGPQGATGATGPAGPSDVPQNSQTSAYTLVLSDNGKHVNITTGGVTVPSGVFSAGNVVSIYNDSASTQTIAQGASVTLREGGTANTGNVSLSQRGLCTILCVASNEFVITGHIA